MKQIINVETVIINVEKILHKKKDMKMGLPINQILITLF